MARPLELIDSLVAEGKEEFTFDEARAALDRSPTATANTLRRLQDNGLVDRLGRGRYVIRPLGSLHTSTTTDDLALAVGATFGDRQHRIAYLSALADLGLLSHPVRTITVACTTQVRVPAISRRPLRVVIERAETIHLEAERLGHSWRSTLDRALFECALRVDLTGGVERLAEAFVNGAVRRQSGPTLTARQGLRSPRIRRGASPRLARPGTRSPAPTRPDRRAQAADGPPRPPRQEGDLGGRRLPGGLEHKRRRTTSGRRELTVLTRHALTRRADTDGVDTPVVERDYVLAHVVAQLHHARPEDGGRLVLKGGTALRFVHLPDYRYSADLDFTVLDGSAEASAAALGKVLEAAREHAGLPHLELTEGDKPAISYVGPLGAARPRQIKLDLATDEHVESVEERTLRNIWPDLPDPLPFAVYPIEEIGAEKLRCVVQRVQCRDLYDLFRLTEDAALSLAEVRPLFARKARAKNLDPGTFAQRFEDRVERYGQRWSTEMGEHLADPPRFDDVVRVVRRQLRKAGLLDI